MIAAMLVAPLAACGTVLPGEGPSAARILEPENHKQPDEYAIVPVSGQVVSVLLAREPEGLRKVFGMGSPKIFRNRIGVGDVLKINIWEAAENGLFSTAEKKRTELPAVQVDSRGRIVIPFVGALRAAGYTPNQMQRRIVNALEGKAISPQVMVNIIKNMANSIVVNGDVRKPGRYQMSLGGDHIL